MTRADKMNTQTQAQALRRPGGISDTLLDVEDLSVGAPFCETPYSYQIKAPPRLSRRPGGLSDTLLN